MWFGRDRGAENARSPTSSAPDGPNPGEGLSPQEFAEQNVDSLGLPLTAAIATEKNQPAPPRPDLTDPANLEHHNPQHSETSPLRDETFPRAHRKRPSIGLALGAGVARGWAHIGVLQVLSEHGLKPDFIAGTSIGAVVGACYAAGKLDQLEDFARSLTRNRIFGLLDINFAGSGLMNGQKITKLLDRELGGISIEDLDPRFVAVATEMRTGHEIWLSRGRLAPALHASYAIPGVFRPHRINQRWLFDGAIVNPVPVSVCRGLGARLVIAVNLQNDSFGRGAVLPFPHQGEEQLYGAANGKEGPFDQEDSLPGVSAVMMDALNIVQDRIARTRLAGDPPDVVIGPKLSDLGLFDFHRAGDAIANGREAAERALPDIMEICGILSEPLEPAAG
jgi:NTE family protein